MVKNRKMLVAVLTVVLLVSMTCNAYAASPNTYAKNLYDWLMDGVKLAVLGTVAFFAIKYLVKRQFVQFIGFAILGMFVMTIVYGPDKLKTVGDYLWNIIFNG